jgi:hypothetical protein
MLGRAPRHARQQHGGVRRAGSVQDEPRNPEGSFYGTLGNVDVLDPSKRHDRVDPSPHAVSDMKLVVRQRPAPSRPTPARRKDEHPNCSQSGQESERPRHPSKPGLRDEPERNTANGEQQ